MAEMPQESAVLVTLYNGTLTIIDRDDVEIISRYTHHYNPQTRYACCNVGPNGHAHPVPIHKMLINAPAGMYIDHINGVRLDNSRANLRLVTPEQSRYNSARNSNASGYKGVGFNKEMGRWSAKIYPNSQCVTIGWFDDPIEAARAYDEKAKELYGEFARLNLP